MSIELYQVIYEDHHATTRKRPKPDQHGIVKGGEILEVDIRVLAESVIEAAQIVTEANRGFDDRQITYVRKLSHITVMNENRYRIVPREAAK